MQSEQGKFNILWSGLIITIFIFLLLQLVSLRGNPEISQNYLSVYTWLMIFNIVGGLISIGFIWAREPLTAHFSPPASSDEYRLIPWTWVKFALIIIFSLLILFSVTTLKIQFSPIPKPLNTGYQLSPMTETYYASVIPGFAEDFAFFWILPQLLFNFLWLIVLLTLKMDLRENKFMWLAGMLVAILIGSVGYGVLIPGFASSHSEVYQDNIPAYWSAFIFGFAQSLLYAITGLFFPLAHIIHNSLYMLGFAVALSIGGVTTGFLPLLKMKWRCRKHEK